jgi:hypothetical protein
MVNSTGRFGKKGVQSRDYFSFLRCHRSMLYSEETICQEIVIAIEISKEDHFGHINTGNTQRRLEFRKKVKELL